MPLLILALWLVVVCVTADAETVRFSLDDLIDSIALVESENNPNAINKSENAIGILQIRPIMVEDFNRIYGTNYPHSIAWNARWSKAIAKGIFKHYTKNLETISAKHCTFIWNGGGSAYKRVDAPRNDLKQSNLERYHAKVICRLNAKIKKG